MIRLYNHVPEDSVIEGWEVFTKTNDKNPKRKSHSISLSGVDRGIFLAIDKNKYEDLTVVEAGRVFPNINQFTKLYSIQLDSDRYLPVITAAQDKSEDRNILMFNYETNNGEVITDINFINMKAISSFITNKDFRTRVTIAAIDVDNNKDFGIEIRYGFNGGKVVQVERIIFANYNTIVEGMKQPKARFRQNNVEYFTIETFHEKVEKISARRLEIPKFDLSTVCVNPKTEE
jgi:hypothetical protein